GWSSWVPRPARSCCSRGNGPLQRSLSVLAEEGMAPFVQPLTPQLFQWGLSVVAEEGRIEPPPEGSTTGFNGASASPLRNWVHYGPLLSVGSLLQWGPSIT